MKTRNQKLKEQSYYLSNEKENLVLMGKLGKKERKKSKKLAEVQFKESVSEELDKFCSPLLRAEFNSKPVGFWSKKLKDLENSLKVKKHGIYEFSETDESENFSKKKKKPKQKARIQKQKQAGCLGFNNLDKKINNVPRIEKKIKQGHSPFRENFSLVKEKGKLAEKSKKTASTTRTASQAVTSTPAVNKDNMVTASNFFFLSPIVKENRAANFNSEKKCTPLKLIVDDIDSHAECLSQETPKIDARQKKITFRRVLRNGKVLII